MGALPCTKCGDRKPDDDFGPAPKNKRRRGRASWCRECAREAAREYKRRNPQKTDPEYARAYWAKKRQQAFDLYGGRCQQCGEDRTAALQFDHVNGDGRVERSTRSNYTILRRILDGEEGYQLLCANCHACKTLAAGEHKQRDLTGSC